MAKLGRQKTEDVIGRAVQAVRFVQTHRCWTIEDLSKELGVHKQSGRRYLAALSLHLPIMEVKPARYGQCGRVAALYALAKEA
ncbi:MAG: hypothetical protein M0036_05045 [Desulfobacteraceae bacterium]|nr:hypothetical protein [Desulfobacteraceae bacterium]